MKIKSVELMDDIKKAKVGASDCYLHKRFKEAFFWLAYGFGVANKAKESYYGGEILLDDVLEIADREEDLFAILDEMVENPQTNEDAMGLWCYYFRLNGLVEKS